MVDPLYTLHTLGDILRVQHIEAFCVCLKFSEIVKVSLTIFVLNSLEKDDPASSISDGEKITCAVEADGRQQIMLAYR